MSSIDDLISNPEKIAQIGAAAVAVCSVLSWWIPKHTIVGRIVQAIALNFGKAGK